MLPRIQPIGTYARGQGAGVDELIAQLTMVGLLLYAITPPEERTAIRLKILHRRIDANRFLAEYYGRKVIDLEMAYMSICETSRMI
jgi:hypothetical protein